MKDYHDALLIIRSGDLPNNKDVRKSIEDTFANRSTDVDFPLSFGDEQIERLQKYWGAHLKKLDSRAASLNLPLNISDIIAEINIWVVSALK